MAKPTTTQVKDVKDNAVKNLVNSNNKAKTPKAKAKPKAKKSIHDSEYGQEVLAVNKQLKAFESSFKGALNRLRSAKGEKALKLTAKQTKIIVKTKKNDKLFAKLAELTTASKAGNYSPFKILQVIRKNQDELLKLIK